MNIHYVVSTFLGNRRIKLKLNPLSYVRQHLNFPYPTTIVCNKFVPEIDDLLVQEIEKYPHVSLILRENVDCSYGAWNHAIIQNIHKNFDYHFLTEDDYIPTNPNFLQPFLNKMSPNVHYVCSKMYHKPILHPCVSNGLLSNHHAQLVFQKHNKIFKLCNAPATNKPTLIGKQGVPWPLPNYRRSLNGLDYRMCEQNQVHFLDYFESELKDIADVASVPFIYPDKKQIELGNPNLPPALVPFMPKIIKLS